MSVRDADTRDSVTIIVFTRGHKMVVCLPSTEAKAVRTHGITEEWARSEMIGEFVVNAALEWRY